MNGAKKDPKVCQYHKIYYKRNYICMCISDVQYYQYINYHDIIFHIVIMI